MFSRPSIETWLLNFLATPLHYSLPVFPFLPTLFKDRCQSGFSHVVSHVLFVLWLRATSSLARPSTVTHIHRIPKAFPLTMTLPLVPHLCAQLWPVHLLSPRPHQVQHVQSGTHHFCLKSVQSPQISFSISFSKWLPFFPASQAIDHPFLSSVLPCPIIMVRFSLKFYVFNQNYYPSY